MKQLKTRTQVIISKDIEELWHPLPTTLPESWTKAAGLLRHKKKELEQHIKKVRLEWDRASKK